MKSLLVVRHAKSDWNNILQPDFERTLNERGLRDAPIMGNRLAVRQFMPDIIVSSSATRTRQTATLIAEALGFPHNKIRFTKDLYHASTFMIMDEVTALDDAYNTAMIVAHNPGVTQFINSIFNSITDNVPTCGMALIEANCDTWIEFEYCPKTLGFYDFPKNGI